MVYVDMESAQFENVNELRNYPFTDESSMVDRFGNELPIGTVSDVHLAIARQIGYGLPSVRLSSVHVSDAMVSACFSAKFGDVSSAMSVTVSSESFKPYFPYMLESLAGTTCAGGVVSFGEIDFSSGPMTYFLDEAIVHPCCVAFTERPGVNKFIDTRSGDYVAGDVEFSFSGYLSSEKSGNSFRIGLEKGASNELASECSKITGVEACGATPIYSINGVRPDEDGNIVLWFR